MRMVILWSSFAGADDAGPWMNAVLNEWTCLMDAIVEQGFGSSTWMRPNIKTDVCCKFQELGKVQKCKLNYPNVTCWNGQCFLCSAWSYAVQGGKKLEAGRLNWFCAGCTGMLACLWCQCSWQAGLALRRLVDLKDVLCGTSGTKDDTRANLHA